MASLIVFGDYLHIDWPLSSMFHTIYFCHLSVCLALLRPVTVRSTGNRPFSQAQELFQRAVFLMLAEAAAVFSLAVKSAAEFESVLDIAPVEDITPVEPFFPQFAPFVDPPHRPKKRHLVKRNSEPISVRPHIRPDLLRIRRSGSASTPFPEDVAIGPKPRVAYQKPMIARNCGHWRNAP
jgi:hypothetical protein